MSEKCRTFAEQIKDTIMDRKEKMIKDKLAKFISRGFETSQHDVVLKNALYGFYVNNFHKVCDERDLPSKLAEELYSANINVKDAFMEIIMDIDEVLYDTIGLRVCSVCGKFIDEGYYIDGDYACSDECAVKLPRYRGMKPGDAYPQLYQDVDTDNEENRGEVYWTDWE